MLGIFKKKDPIVSLQKQYEKKMTEAHQISQTNRKLGDEKYAEAEEIMQKIEVLTKNSTT